MNDILVTINKDLIIITQDGRKLLIDKNNKLFNELLDKIKDKSKNESKNIIKQWYLENKFNNLNN